MDVQKKQQIQVLDQQPESIISETGTISDITLSKIIFKDLYKVGVPDELKNFYNLEEQIVKVFKVIQSKQDLILSQVCPENKLLQDALAEDIKVVNSYYEERCQKKNSVREKFYEALKVNINVFDNIFKKNNKELWQDKGRPNADVKAVIKACLGDMQICGDNIITNFDKNALNSHYTALGAEFVILINKNALFGQGVTVDYRSSVRTKDFLEDIVSLIFTNEYVPSIASDQLAKIECRISEVKENIEKVKNKSHQLKEFISLNDYLPSKILLKDILLEHCGNKKEKINTLSNNIDRLLAIIKHAVIPIHTLLKTDKYNSISLDNYKCNQAAFNLVSNIMVLLERKMPLLITYGTPNNASIIYQIMCRYSLVSFLMYLQALEKSEKNVLDLHKMESILQRNELIVHKKINYANYIRNAIVNI